MVHGSNNEIERRSLWEDLRNISRAHRNEKWTIMGDFNEVLTSEERLDKGTYDDTGPSKGCNK